jgi:hypothetical protein
MRARRLVIITVVVLAVLLVLFAVYGFFNGVPGGEMEPGTGL